MGTDHMIRHPSVLFLLLISIYTASSVKTVPSGSTPVLPEPGRSRRPMKWDGIVLVKSYFNGGEGRLEEVKILKKFPKGTNSTIVYEGDTADLFCNLTRGRITPYRYRVKWRIKTDGEYHSPGELTESYPDKYTYSEQHNLTRLKIIKSNITDRGWYQCALWDSELCPQFQAAKNGCIIQTYEIQLRVKQYGEELIPSVSIGIEIIVLFLVILIYEKRKNKTEVEESDTEGSPDHKNLSDTNGDGVSEATRLAKD